VSAVGDGLVRVNRRARIKTPHSGHNYMVNGNVAASLGMITEANIGNNRTGQCVGVGCSQSLRVELVFCTVGWLKPLAHLL